jgi:hypothetical protein
METKYNNAMKELVGYVKDVGIKLYDKLKAMYAEYKDKINAVIKL